jgi:hypothetical protein
MVITHQNPKYENNPQISSSEVFFCNYSSAFRNKRKKYKGINTGYFPTTFTPDGLITVLKKGHAITTGFYGKVDNYGFPKTDTAHWKSSRLLIIDCDNRSLYQLNQDDFVKQYAMCIYVTPSSKPENLRSRAIFLLDTPITDAEQYKELATTLALYTLRHLDPDPNATKLTQRVYGSSRGYFIERPENILPLSVIKHQVTQYRAEKIIDAIMPAKGSKKIAIISSLSKEFHFHSNNTDSLLAGETLVEGDRNNRINQASYNLTLRGWGEEEVLRKILPLATFSGLGIRESERSILSGIKGAKRDMKKYFYVDNRHRHTELTDEAKRLLISVMQHDWKSGYTAMIAVAMCKMFARQGQAFHLTNSLIQRMTGFDAKTVAKHLKTILKTGIFKATKKQATYRAKPTTDNTTLTIDGQTYTLTASIFEVLLENRTNTETLKPAELLTFMQMLSDKTQRKTLQYSRTHAQKAISKLKQLGVLVRKGWHYAIAFFKGLTVARTKQKPTITTNDLVVGENTPHSQDAQKPRQLRHQNGVFGLDNGMAERLTPQME